MGQWPENVPNLKYFLTRENKVLSEQNMKGSEPTLNSPP